MTVFAQTDHSKNAEQYAHLWCTFDLLAYTQTGRLLLTRLHSPALKSTCTHEFCITNRSRLESLICDLLIFLFVCSSLASHYRAGEA